jgi:XrtJ-associated TM-motif-TM protein
VDLRFESDRPTVEGEIMKKSLLLLFAVAAAVLTAALPVYAQGGCVNSPENPTVVLALVGFAGAFLSSRFRK